MISIYVDSDAEIGDTLGPFDLAMLPIGAYAPRDLMCCQHMCPEGNLFAFLYSS